MDLISMSRLEVHAAGNENLVDLFVHSSFMFSKLDLPTTVGALYGYLLKIERSTLSFRKINRGALGVAFSAQYIAARTFRFGNGRRGTRSKFENPSRASPRAFFLGRC